MFESAARLKLRIATTRGVVSVEDLWDLPLQGKGLSLDQIAIALHRQIKDVAEVSFVTETPKANTELELSFDLVKHIIMVKKAEQATALAARAKAATKQRILEVIAKKKDEQLESASEEDLLKMLEDL